MFFFFWFIVKNFSFFFCFYTGLNGDGDWEAAKIDELVQGLEDLHQKLTPWFKEQNEAKKVYFLFRFFFFFASFF